MSLNGWWLLLLSASLYPYLVMVFLANIEPKPSFTKRLIKSLRVLALPAIIVAISGCLGLNQLVIMYKLHQHHPDGFPHYDWVLPISHVLPVYYIFTAVLIFFKARDYSCNDS